MYKYFRVNDHALTNLAGGQLYCHHYEDFNDPFECWCHEVRSIPDAVTEPERFVRVRDTWLGPNNPGADDPELMKSFAEYVDSLTDYPWSIVEDTKNSARIGCFSETGENLLMWAHYGDGLRGFCVEFDEEELLRGLSATAEVFHVQYQDSPEPFDVCIYEVARDQMEWHEEQLAEARDGGQAMEFGLYDDFQRVADNSRRLMREMYAKLLATKPIEWKYEQEMRLILHVDSVDRAGVLLKYSDRAVKSLIVGDRMSTEYRSTLSRILREKGLAIPVRVARRDPSSFKVNFRD